MQLVRLTQSPEHIRDYRPTLVRGVFACFNGDRYAVLDYRADALYYVDGLVFGTTRTVFRHDCVEYNLIWTLSCLQLIDDDNRLVQSVATHDGFSFLRRLYIIQMDTDNHVTRVICTCENVIVELTIDWTKVK